MAAIANPDEVNLSLLSILMITFFEKRLLFHFISVYFICVRKLIPRLLCIVFKARVTFFLNAIDSSEIKSF